MGSWTDLSGAPVGTATGIAAGEPGEMFVVRAPSPALAPFVARLAFRVQARGRRELLLPTGARRLGVSLGEGELRFYERDDGALVHASRAAVVLGSPADPVIVEGDGPCAIALVFFRPGGSYPFLSAPESAIDEPLVDLEALWGRAAAVLRERLLDAPTPEAALSVLDTVLSRHVVGPPVPDPVVAAAALLGRGVAVARVADRVGWTDRTLQRHFTDMVGLTPKRFARVRRLQRLLASIPTDRQVDWARVAVEYGYFDQAHLINDFRALTGMTPSAFQRLPCGHHHLPPKLSDSSNP